MDYSGLTYAKLSKEDAKILREKEKAEVRACELAQKKLVVMRDGSHYCRLVPHCDSKGPFETAHVDAKGMGGDRGLRSTAENMLRGCFEHHRGNWSLHSHDLRVEYLSSENANGPIAVWGRDRLGNWYLIGRESAVGVWEHD